jgi:enolase-phosphatase E1
VGVRREGEPNAGADFGDLPVIASFDELDVDAAVPA